MTNQKKATKKEIIVFLGGLTLAIAGLYAISGWQKASANPDTAHGAIPSEKRPAPKAYGDGDTVISIDWGKVKCIGSASSWYTEGLFSKSRGHIVTTEGGESAACKG